MGRKLSDLRRALADYGLELQNTKRGPHPWKVIGLDASGLRQAYPIPAHQGLRSEVKPEYLAGCCRKFGLDVDAVKTEMDW